MKKKYFIISIITALIAIITYGFIKGFKQKNYCPNDYIDDEFDIFDACDLDDDFEED